MGDHRISRRHFFHGALLTAAVPAGGFGRTPSLRLLGYKSPNEKLNIAAVGAGGKGASDIAGCETENIVALCDVDAKRAEGTFKKYEKAPKYTDFRRMLDKEGKTIDAVTVTIPDFMHGTVAMWAMERGKHVYVQKPLTRTIWEARMLTQAAVKYKVATQMGNQGYSNEGARQCAEMIWNGDIGNVTEVHAWTNRPVWPQGIATLPPEEKVPDTLDWNAWLGIATARPYSSAYLPFSWRGWFDFGSGALGDMACHVLGAPNMALMLGAPTSVECIEQEGKNPYTFPTKSVIRFDFPARGSMPAVKLFWHDGTDGPPYRPEGVPADEKLGDLPNPDRPARAALNPTDAAAGAPPASAASPRPGRVGSNGGSGVLFIGDKGFITAGEYGASARLVPAEKMKDYKFPAPLLTRSPGHYRDWIRACKNGDRSCSDFSVAGPFTEWILVGVLALRFEGKLEWDSAKMKVTNVPEANQYIKPKFRDGWKLS